MQQWCRIMNASDESSKLVIWYICWVNIMQINYRLTEINIISGQYNFTHIGYVSGDVRNKLPSDWTLCIMNTRCNRNMGGASQLILHRQRSHLFLFAFIDIHVFHTYRETNGIPETLYWYVSILCQGRYNNSLPFMITVGPFIWLGTGLLPRVSDPYMHHGTCVTHFPWCMPVSSNSGFLWSRWRGKRSRNFTYLARGQWILDGT